MSFKYLKVGIEFLLQAELLLLFQTTPHLSHRLLSVKQ